MKSPFRYIFLLLLMVACSTSLFAQVEQKSALIFKNATHDFGHIEEEGGAVACRFEAKNSGDSAVEVVEIVTTCGCTTAEYDKKSIAPGATFSFKVVFNPLGRPGRIDKQIFVRVSDCEAELRLNIAGYVNARERTVEELYPFDMGGGLRLKSNFHAFGYLEHGKEMSDYIGYVNTSDHTIEVGVEYLTMSGILALSCPHRIEPGARGDIALSYTVNEDSELYGTCRDVVRLSVDGVPSYYTFTSQVVVTDNFDNMDDISAPKLVISKNIIKFGEVNCSNDVLEQRVVLTNDGCSPLVVRAIESSSQAVECPMQHAITIAPGASREVVVRLCASRIEDVDNPFTARVYIISNDPLRPMQSVRVNALPL